MNRPRPVKGGEKGNTVEIRKGMLFKGIVNDRIIEILRVSDTSVVYKEKDVVNGTMYNVSRKTFERCMIELVED